MADFLSSKPGSTNGPAGIVHSVALSEYLVFDRPGPSRRETAKILYYLHNKWLPGVGDGRLIRNEIQSENYFKDRNLQRKDSNKIYKMLRSSHADAMCSRGEIGLGPVEYYSSVENESILDEKEGIFIAHAVGVERTVSAVLRAGNHVLVYCTTEDKNTTFSGYGACVEISDIGAFTQFVGRAIVRHFENRDVLSSIDHGPCVYQHSRVTCGKLHGFAEVLVRAGEMSVNTIDMLSHKQYLIKEKRFARDKEYRMSFVMRGDVPGYTIVNCPEIVKLCRRIR